jgi:DNA-binding SARP family transcriptional activator
MDSLFYQRDYAHLAAWLREQRLIYDKQHKPVISRLLEASAELCEVLRLCSTDPDWHQLAVENLSGCEAALRDRLMLLLQTAAELNAPEASLVHANTAALEPMASLNPISAFRRWLRPLPTVPLPVEAPPPDLIVYTLGAFEVYRDQRLIQNWNGRKGAGILKYLLLHQGQAIHKEVLMETFWPDSDVESARNTLNQAVFQLRQALANGEFDQAANRYILYQHEHYSLNPELTIWMDYQEFNACYEAATRALRQQQENAAMANFASAEALYRGEFLPDARYDEWTEPMRRLLEGRFLQVMDTLGAHYLAAGDYAACSAISNRQITLDPAAEEAHRRLIRCYRAQGQHFLAQRQYHQCVTALREHLGVAPSIETEQLLY